MLLEASDSYWQRQFGSQWMSMGTIGFGHARKPQQKRAFVKSAQLYKLDCRPHVQHENI